MGELAIKSPQQLTQTHWCVVDWNGYLPNLKAHIQRSGKTFWEYFGISFDAMQSGGFIAGGIYTLIEPYNDGHHAFAIVFFLPEGIGIALVGKPENYAHLDTPLQVIERCRELLRQGNIDTSTPEFRANFKPDTSLRRLLGKRTHEA